MSEFVRNSIVSGRIYLHQSISVFSGEWKALKGKI